MQVSLYMIVKIFHAFLHLIFAEKNSLKNPLRQKFIMVTWKFQKQ